MIYQAGKFLVYKAIKQEVVSQAISWYNNRMKTAKEKSVKLDLTPIEVGYLSSLVEAQVSRLSVLDKKNLAKNPFKEEYKVFNKLGDMLSS